MRETFPIELVQNSAGLALTRRPLFTSTVLRKERHEGADLEGTVRQPVRKEERTTQLRFGKSINSPGHITQ